jgi:opacity protein-like surface antigen
LKQIHACHVAAVLAFLLALPAGVLAQSSTTRGLSLGFHLSAASLTVEGQDRNDAAGGGISVGYGVNRNIMLFAQLDGAQFENQVSQDVQGDWRLGHVDLGVRYHFANALRRWVPYAQASFGYRAVTVVDPTVDGVRRNEVELSGGGFSLGGGLAYYLSEAFSLDAQLLWTGGEFTTLRVDNISATGFDVDATSSRFNLGVSWWP